MRGNIAVAALFAVSVAANLAAPRVAHAEAGHALVRPDAKAQSVDADTPSPWLLLPAGTAALGLVAYRRRS